MEPWQIAIAYHERTKHHFNRFAPSLGYLDWATQPNPFRRFGGARLIPLPLAHSDPGVLYDDLFISTLEKPQPVDLQSMGLLFELSLALSAWKQYKDSRWALRINPSSGNLHPTEGYLIIGSTTGLSETPGVFHYAAQEHALEHRATLRAEAWAKLFDFFTPGAFFVALTSILWREAWKYGERAFRYCQHDAGHAMAAVSLSAALQGWSCRCVHSLSDADIAHALGLDRPADFEDAELEHPDVVLAIEPADPSDHGQNGWNVDPRLPQFFADLTKDAEWTGRANQLSRDHVHWEVIDAAAQACEKPRSVEPPLPESDAPSPHYPARQKPLAAQIIRQRRSAVAFDGETFISDDEFYRMMDRTLPRFKCVPWSTLGPPALVHLGLFVHRVRDLSPGLYLLSRDPDQLDALQEATHRRFEWKRPERCPSELPLFLLQAGDCRRLAAQVSCGQDIAGDSALSLGMIAQFEQPMRRLGGWAYRRLHWETGLIGQVLYLEAEAVGVRATGIGCFFDDPVHQVFGLTGAMFQTLYHFTIGGPVEDARLTTLPPYSAARRAATKTGALAQTDQTLSTHSAPSTREVG